jgi:hypothetical protein
VCFDVRLNPLLRFFPWNPVLKRGLPRDYIEVRVEEQPILAWGDSVLIPLGNILQTGSTMGVRFSCRERCHVSRDAPVYPSGFK